MATGGITAYLAQHDLLAQIPELADACSSTPSCVGLDHKADGGDESKNENAVAAAMRRVWLGPAGTVTPLHRDPYHNALCQVWGTKLVRMYRASDSPRMYPFPGGFLRNTSMAGLTSGTPGAGLFSHTRLRGLTEAHPTRNRG